MKPRKALAQEDGEMWILGGLAFVAVLWSRRGGRAGW